MWVTVAFFLTFVSACMGEDDLDEAHCSCDEDMKPESWEEMLESRIGACWGSAELRYRWRLWWLKRWCEEEEEEEEGEWEWEPLDPLESLLLTLFRLLWKGVRNEEMTKGGRLTVTGRMKEIKHGQRYRQKKDGWHKRRGLGECGGERAGNN